MRPEDRHGFDSKQLGCLWIYGLFSHIATHVPSLGGFTEQLPTCEWESTASETHSTHWPLSEKQKSSNNGCGAQGLPVDLSSASLEGSVELSCWFSSAEACIEALMCTEWLFVYLKISIIYSRRSCWASEARYKWKWRLFTGVTHYNS